jgi:hypothetical protein
MGLGPGAWVLWDSPECEDFFFQEKKITIKTAIFFKKKK